MATKSSPAAMFVRNLLIHKPGIKISEIQKAYDDKGLPKAERPSDQKISNLKSALKTKYDLKSFDDFPRRANGNPSISALLDGILKRRPDIENKEALELLASDGLSFTSSLFWQRRKALGEKKSKVSSKSPDPNQNAGPRAQLKKVRRKKRRKVEEISTSESDRSTVLRNAYELAEESIDEIIHLCDAVKNSEAAKALRAARRQIAVGYMSVK